LPESVARVYTCEIITALGYMHFNEMIYRDLKPRNILIEESGHVKLSNFGLSTGVDEISKSAEFNGTPIYYAPEVWQGLPYGKTLDWYSLGVILYEMLIGQPPFYAKDEEEMKDNILNGTLEFDSSLSTEAVDLIAQLLHRNPIDRLGANGAEEVMGHAFFKGVDWGLFAAPEPVVQDLPTVPDRALI